MKKPIFKTVLAVVISLAMALTVVPKSFAYEVKSGDTLSRIAKENHTSVEAIAKANNISDPGKIYVGQVLNLGDFENLASLTNADIAFLKEIFDADFYAKQNTDALAAYGLKNIFDHFITYGMAECRQPNAKFNVNAYVSAYPDLQKEFKDYDAFSKVLALYRHYRDYGIAENRTYTDIETVYELGFNIISATDFDVVLREVETLEDDTPTAFDLICQDLILGAVEDIFRLREDYRALISDSLYNYLGNANEDNIFEYVNNIKNLLRDDLGITTYNSVRNAMKTAYPRLFFDFSYYVSSPEEIYTTFAGGEEFCNFMLTIDARVSGFAGLTDPVAAMELYNSIVNDFNHAYNVSIANMKTKYGRQFLTFYYNSFMEVLSDPSNL